MDIRTRFLTASRADLFDLSRRIFGALDNDVLADAAKPLLVGIGGSMKAGKKIISDVAVETLLADGGAVMNGRAGADEYWTGSRNGQALDVRYIDMAYGRKADYSDRLWQKFGELEEPDNHRKMAALNSGRMTAGVCLMQNPHGLSAITDMNIYIESLWHEPVCYELARHALTPKSLRDEFCAVNRADKWARYVEIEVRSPRLQASAAFNDMMLELHPYCRLPPASQGLRNKLRQIFFIDREQDIEGVQAQTVIYGRDIAPAGAMP